VPPEVELLEEQDVVAAESEEVVVVASVNLLLLAKILTRNLTRTSRPVKKITSRTFSHALTTKNQQKKP
jgi:hypothetical protein